MAKSKLIAILVIAFIVIFYGVSPVKASFKYDDSGCCVCPPWDGMGIDDTKRENAGPPVIYIDDTQPLMTPSKPSCLRYEREEFKIVRKCDLFEVSCSQVNNKTEKRGLPITPPTLEVLKFIKLQDRATLSQEKDASGNQYYEIPWIAEAISSLYKFGVSAAAILAVVMIIVGGFIWLTSAGNQTQITEAKGYIFGAAIGLLIALGSYVLLYTINPELVRLKPIKIPYVEHEDLLTITSEENQQPDDGGGGNASSYSGGQNNGMRYYNQGDEGDIPGFHKWGCACSSVAMAISKFGGNLTPTGCAHKYIKPPENMNIPGKRIIDVSSALKDNKLQVEKVESLGDAKTRITAAIKNGSVIIALIKSGSTGHYLIIANADDIGVSLLDPGRRSNTGCTWNELISGIPGDKSRRPLRSYYIISK